MDIPLTSLPGLPENIIYDICLQLNTEDLSNLMRSHSRIYQICSNILNQKLLKRKQEIEIPLRNIVSTVKGHTHEKGILGIGIQVLPVNIKVNYSVKENPSILFISEKERIRITFPTSEILRFVEFLRTLTQGKGNFIFQQVIFHIDPDDNSVIIHEIRYPYSEFTEALQDVITYLSRRYYNLSIGIESEYYL